MKNTKRNFIQLGLLAALLVLPLAGRAQLSFTTNSGAITITGYNTAAGLDVFIPAAINGHPVTSIGDGAFAQSSLTSIVISYGITNIGNEAFFESDLTSIAIPNSVTTIGAGAFKNCYVLTSVSIPSSVVNLGQGVFAGYNELTDVTIANAIIGNDEFADCVQLTGITIPASVTNIGTGAFDTCLSLTAITVAAGNTNYSSVDGVLFDKKQTSLLGYPPGKIGIYTISNSVTTIGTNAFENCGLTNIIIPSSVNTIPDSAFEDSDLIILG